MLVAAFALTFLLIGSSAEKLLGSEKCTWGPAYWCSDVGSAKECDAVQHCITTSWKNDPTPDVELDGCCESCQTLVDRLRNYAVLSERDVLILLNTACDAVPVDKFKQQCKDGVKKYVKEVMDMVVAKIDPKKICSLIRLCKKKRSSKHASRLPRVHLVGPLGALKANGDTETCEMCKLAVIEANHYIANKDNQKAIVDYLKSAGCSRCPETAECESLIDQYAPIVFQLLEQELQGTALCVDTGLCGSKGNVNSDLEQLLRTVHTMYQADSTKTCAMCKNATAQARAILSDKTKRAEIKNFIRNKMCLLCPSKDKCQADVDQYFDLAFDFIDQELAGDTLCKQLHLCPASMLLQSPTAAPTAAPGTETCELCKLTMLQVNEFIANADNQKKMIAYVETAGCSRCPAPDKCKSAIQEYAPVVFKFLKAELNGELCGMFGLCGSRNHPMKLVLTQLVHAMTNIYKTENGEVCDLCKDATARARAIFSDKKKRAALKDLIKKRMCALCPAKDKCQADVEKYIDKVFAFIDKELAGDTLCKQLHLCSATTRSNNLLSSPGVQTMQKPMTSVSVSGVQCTICEFVMKEVDSLLKNNRTDKAIIAALDKVCSILPKTVSNECVSFVKQYGNLVIQLLVQELDPAMICTALSLCSGSQAPKPQPLLFTPLLVRGAPIQRPMPTTVKLGVTCVLCEYVLTKLDNILKENSTETEIVDALDKVCSLLPGSVGTECDKLVKKYGPAIVKLLAAELRPSLVCTILGLCPISKDVHLPTSGELCETCQTLMMYIDSLLKENSTQEEVEHLLLKVCNFLPESIRGECNMVVMLYTPELVQMIINKLSPNIICSELRLCTGSKAKFGHKSTPLLHLTQAKSATQRKVPRRLLGTKKCLYGPSYWCASRYNARKCKAEAHCEEHFWSKNNSQNLDNRVKLQ